MEFDPQKISKHSYTRLVLILVAWTAYGVFFASQGFLRQAAYSASPPKLQDYLVPWLICAYSWALLTPLIVSLSNRFPFTRNTSIRSAVVQIPSAIIISFVQIGLFVVVSGLLFGLGPYTFSERYGFMIIQEFHQSVLVYFLIVAICHAGRIFFKRSEIQPAAAEDEDLEFAFSPESVEPLVLSSPPKVLRSGSEQTQKVSRLSVKQNGRIVLLDVSEIERITSEGNYVVIRTADNKYLLRETMNAMETKLDPNEFVRLRRSTIVRIEEIKEFRPMFNGEYEIVLKSGARLSSSRRYRRNLDAILKS